jgi:hypothetical protein
LAKQQTSLKNIFKIHSARLRQAKWKLTLSLEEARQKEEIVSLADSQVLRWIDELNGVTDLEQEIRAVKAQIRAIRKEANSVQNRRRIRQLYAELDQIQFQPDYMCLIIDRKKDYWRACKGFQINDVVYHRLLGTNGGVKCSTIVFVSDKVGPELRRRIENGRDQTKELVPAKLEAYKALTCSASIPVSMPRGLIVVSDCETHFTADTIYLDNELGGEPVMEFRPDSEVELCESDGYGLMLPSAAQRWSDELQLNYVPSGMNTRFSWEKGMLYTFDFVEFAERVAGTYTVTDAWGTERDVREAEVIMPVSMLKLWDSYDSLESYMDNCLANNYRFSVAKVCPRELENERALNYQFTQSYDLSDDDIEQLVSNTASTLEDVLGGDYRKTLLFLRGKGMSADNVPRSTDDFAKAIMADPRVLDDPFVRGKVSQLIRNRINEAKVGVIDVHGNYSMISGDPYALCQSVFGLPVTGILQAGEIYNRYWLDSGAKALACFRAPMTCHNNIRYVRVAGSDEARYWYRYMTTCTVFNAWDTAAQAMNGADKDGDMAFLTDDPILVERLVPLPALTCVQRKAAKKVVEEADIVQSNINSFGDDIGRITNRITSMFEVQSRFEPGSREHEVLSYRIKCGQLLQQDAIDKAKGIISKPMPREWFDRRQAAQIENESQRELYLNIVADRKPYFMRYIYPDLMKQYNKFHRNARDKLAREYDMSLQELLDADETSLSAELASFRHYYNKYLPVGTGPCVQNRICRRFEKQFDHRSLKQKGVAAFDYTIMKSGAWYSSVQYSTIQKLSCEYVKRCKEFAVEARKTRLSKDDIQVKRSIMIEEFTASCYAACSNEKALCDILLDVCYQHAGTKQLVWDVCAHTIVSNLVEHNGGNLSFPVADPNGDIAYGGDKFAMCQIQIGVVE